MLFNLFLSVCTSRYCTYFCFFAIGEEFALFNVGWFIMIHLIAADPTSERRKSKNNVCYFYKIELALT
jgi:hypothetical protein